MGVKNLEKMKAFYQNTLDFSEIFAEFEESEHETMHQLFRVSPIRFASIMFNQKAGGVVVELIQTRSSRWAVLGQWGSVAEQ